MNITEEQIKQKKTMLEEYIKVAGTHNVIVDAHTAKALDMSSSDFYEFLKLTTNQELASQYRNLKRGNFYAYSIENKIAKGIDLYIQEELMKDVELDDLKIIVDITEYQKQLQPFTINQERISITNPRDVITRPENTNITEEEIKELEEHGIEIIKVNKTKESK